jgi:hypothetical protein
MRQFFCIGPDDSILGIVSALTGELAWATAQVLVPGVSCLREKLY